MYLLNKTASVTRVQIKVNTDYSLQDIESINHDVPGGSVLALLLVVFLPIPRQVYAAIWKLYHVLDDSFVTIISVWEPVT